jgi:hypothetical protein
MGALSFLERPMSRLLRIRLVGLLLVSCLFTAVTAVYRPDLLIVSAYKLSLVTTAGWGAYWGDVWMFHYARPDRFLVAPVSIGGPKAPEGAAVVIPVQELPFAASMLRRAIIVVGAMIAAALGA